MFIQPKNTPIIKVVGVGGMGSKEIREMKATNKYQGIEFITVHKEAFTLEDDPSITSILLSDITHASYDLEESYKKWRANALTHKEDIKSNLEGADIVFIYCNEGKGIGTGVSPVVANIAHECGALVIAIVTKPFTLEGKQKKRVAEIGIEELRQSADMVIPISKQKLFDYHVKGTPIRTEFDKLKAPLYDGVRIISDIIRLTQLINIDLEDLRLIIQNSGDGFIGEGEGVRNPLERLENAIDRALSCSLTNNTLTDAESVLIHITGGPDLSMSEVDQLCSTITSSMRSQTHMKFGLTVDEKFIGKIKLCIIGASLRKHPSICENPPNKMQSMLPTDSIVDLNIPAFLRRNNRPYHSHTT